MLENLWNPLPYPFWETATPQPVKPQEMAPLIERVLEDAAGVAGTIATAAAHPECDQADIIFATRLLAEWLHALVALWREWQKQEEPDETA